MTQLKIKYNKIFEKHPRVNLENIDLVNETIKEMEKKSLDITTSNIAKKIKLTNSEINTAIHWLVEYKFLRKSGSGNTIKYMRTTDRKNNAEFLWGREAIQGKIIDNLNILRNNQRLKEHERLKELHENGSNSFFKELNNIIDTVWKENEEYLGLEKMEFLTRATRYSMR